MYEIIVCSNCNELLSIIDGEKINNKWYCDDCCNKLKEDSLMKTEIICILDKSGSMHKVKNDAIEGFKKFINDQKQIGNCNITIVWFDTNWEIEYEGPLKDYTPPDEYPAQGLTALYDAIGKTINHINPRLSKESPDKVILAILTDGEENSSTEFDEKKINEIIKHHVDKYNWNVVYLAADQDAWDAASKIGIPKDFVFNYTSSDTKEGFDIYSRTISSLRK